MPLENLLQFGRFKGPLLMAFVLTLAISLFFYYYQDVPLDLGSTTVLFAIVTGAIALVRWLWARANGRTDDDKMV